VVGQTTQVTLAPQSAPLGIANGPDGNIWFTNQTAGQIGVIPAVTHVPVLVNLTNAACAPTAITAGPDGRMWFTEQAAATIGAITLDGKTISEYAAQGTSPTGIAAGPDGALWYTLQGTNAIGRMTAVGAATTFALKTAAAMPQGIALGTKDGNLWFTENAAGQIAQITPLGVQTEWAVPTPTGGAKPAPTGIVGSADGTLWFSDAANSRIVKFTPPSLASAATTSATRRSRTAGDVLTNDALFTPVALPAGSQPQGLTVDTSGNVWVANTGLGTVSQVTPTGTVTNYPLPSGTTGQVTNVVIGSDGSLYVTQPGSSSITQVVATVPTATVVLVLAPTTATVVVGNTLQFATLVTGAPDTTVTWAVTEGASGGTVSASGLYTAPATPGTYHVVATSHADPTKTATAVVTVTSNVATVTGSAVYTYWSDSGSTNQTLDLTQATLNAYVPNGSGGFTTLPVTGTSTGSFGIANVPPGHFWLQDGTRYLWTANTNLDLGQDIGGRAGVVAATVDPTNLVLNMTGMTAWNADDAIEYYCSNSGDWAAFGANGDPWNAGAPNPGDTALAGATIDWTETTSDLGLGLLPDATQGDQPILTHLTTKLAGTVPYQILDGTYTLPKTTWVDGQTTTVTGAFAPPSASIGLNLTVKTTAFEAYLSAMNPGLPGNAVQSLFEAAVDATPFPVSKGFISRGGAPDLFYVAGDLTLPDVAFGTLSIGNPYPSYTPFMTTALDAWVSLTAPGAANVAWAFAGISSNTALPASGPLVVTPLLSPVQAPQFNGTLNLFNNNTNVGVTPVLSWTAPALGMPTGYNVKIVEVKGDGKTGTTTTQVALLSTAVTPIQVPPGILLPGHSYYLTLTAVAAAALDFESGPYRTTFPFSEAGLISGLFSPTTADSWPQVTGLIGQNVAPGTTATFTALATGTGTLTYQWQRSANGGSTWTPITGATQSTYQTPVTSVADNGTLFRVAVTNALGTNNSRVARLEVTPGVTVQSNVTSLATNLAASVTPVTGATYLWTISGGTLSSSPTASSVTYAANASGTVTLTCTMTVPGGVAPTVSTGTAIIVPAPTITSFTPSAVSTGPGTAVTLTAVFSAGPGGTASVNQGVGTVASGVAVSTPALSAPTNFTLTVTNAAGLSVTATTRVIAGSLTLLAGFLNNQGTLDGNQATAELGSPAGLVWNAGNLLLMDSYNGGGTLRQVTAGGTVTTLAGTPGYYGYSNSAPIAFNFPQGCALDAAGNLFIADQGNHVIRRRDAITGVFTTYAGTPGVAGWQDGAAASALFNYPGGVTVDPTGNVYVADSTNNLIRMISPAMQVTTLAGFTPPDGSYGSANGPVGQATFNYPMGIAIDVNGDLYVTDDAPFGYGDLRLIAGGTVTTLVPGLNNPIGVAVDSNLNAFVAVSGENRILEYETLPSHIQVPFAGTGAVGWADGAALTTATFFDPTFVALDPSGNLYVSDGGNTTIREISGGMVTTLAGRHGNPGTQDGTGNGAQFTQPWAIAQGPSGNFYIADTGNNSIRRLTSAGVVTTLAGSDTGMPGFADGNGSVALFNTPIGIAVDAAENVYVADYTNSIIRKVVPGATQATTTVSTIVGQAGVRGWANGNGITTALLRGPQGVACDAAGNLYIADTKNHCVRKMTPDGTVSTIAGVPGTLGHADGPAATTATVPATLDMPQGLLMGSNGVLYIVDVSASTIRTLSADGTTVATLAGTAYQYGPSDGVGAAATFYTPNFIVADPAGNLYVNDFGRIRRINPVTAKVETIIGTPGSIYGNIMGPLPAIINPIGLALDPVAGNLHILTTDAVLVAPY